jgi:hypothetical protein
MEGTLIHKLGTDGRFLISLDRNLKMALKTFVFGYLEEPLINVSE